MMASRIGLELEGDSRMSNSRNIWKWHDGQAKDFGLLQPAGAARP